MRREQQPPRQVLQPGQLPALPPWRLPRRPFGLPLFLELLCAGTGFFLPLFGALLDAAHRAQALGAVRSNGLAAVLAQGLGALVQAHRAKGGELAQLHAVQPLVGAGRHAHAALTALPRGDYHAGLAVRQVLLLQGTCTAGFFALAAGKALVGEAGQIAAVVQGIVRHGGLELPGALVQQQAEVCTAVLVGAQAGQHAQQLFGAALGAVAHLLEHLAAGELLDVVGGFVRLIGQREAGLKHRFPKNSTRRVSSARSWSAQVSFSHSPQGSGPARSFVQGQIGQRLPGKGRDAGAHHGVLRADFSQPIQMVSLSVSAAEVSRSTCSGEGRCSGCGIRRRTDRSRCRGPSP